MKKSLLALAVVAVAASANAATVYDKDGTSLTLDGRVQAVFYNGNHGKAEHCFWSHRLHWWHRFIYGRYAPLGFVISVWDI